MIYFGQSQTFRKIIRNTSVIAISFCIASTMWQSALAQEEKSVIAKIDGVEITERDLAYAEVDLASQFRQVPDAQRKAAILNALIDIKILAKAAEAEGLGDDEAFKSRMQFLRERALHNNYFQKNALEAVTDEDVRERYEKEIAAMEKTEEVRARHILVKTKEEAEEIVKAIEAGGDFEETAKEKSTGPSGPQGGDLGFFAKGQMVPEFDAAVFALADGEMAKEPVQTQFGWHIIKREESRVKEPPAFDAAKDAVRQIVLREKYADLVKASREGVAIEVMDENLRKQLESAAPSLQ
ncbi:MAG: peptidylprolyl isomerase [Rhizobiaceae bacterium]